MVEKSLHLNQLSLRHMCKIGLKIALDIVLSVKFKWQTFYSTIENCPVANVTDDHSFHWT
jgi:hypothetical protein